MPLASSASPSRSPPEACPAPERAGTCAHTRHCRTRRPRSTRLWEAGVDFPSAAAATAVADGHAGRGSRATRRTMRSYLLVAREQRRGDDDASGRRELRGRVKGLDECFEENAGSTCFIGDRFLQRCGPGLGLGGVSKVVRSSVEYHPMTVFAAH